MGVTGQVREPVTQEARRRAVESLLAWEGIARASNLSRMLSYLCEMALDGRAEEVKEYTVAVSAFGRPGDFDPKKDSIVRVEAHRLRKSLQKYYETEGAGSAVRVVLPTGSYVLQFEKAESEPVVSRPAAPARGRGRYWLAGAAVAGLAVAGWLIYSGDARQETASRRAAPAPASEMGEGVVRIRCGAETDLLDSGGRRWLADRHFSGGKGIQERTRFIRGTMDPALYLSRREGEFSYSIPLENGIYELRLHFAETQYGPENSGRGGENSRVFSVQMNGKPLIPGIDILNDAGGANTANIRVFKNVEPAEDGKLHLAFVPLKWEKPMVSAIEIAPGVRGRMAPIRITTAPHDVTDHAGRVWRADRYFTGGLSLRPAEAVTGTADDELFAFHRFGHFTYTIPVAADGRYTVKLRFSEHNFGPGRPGGASVGRRVFHVFCNGEALLRNFDMLAEAGPVKPIEKVFRNLQPSAQSKLVLQFTPVKNYALINTIEVLDESGS